MKYIYPLLLIALISSCGIPLPLQKDLVVKDRNAVRQFATTAPAFNSFVDDFEIKGKAITGNANFSVGDVPINFGDTENPNFQGVCFEYPDGTKEVIIKKSWWDANNNHNYRESLIFHELGHCVLGRDHLDDTAANTEDSFKISMMNSVIVAPEDYQPHRDQYHEELFTQDYSALVMKLSLIFSP
jgi:hypothetical protein